MGLPVFTRLLVWAALLCACRGQSGTATQAATTAPPAASLATTGSNLSYGGCYFADAYGADPTGAQLSDAAIAQMLTAIGTNNGCMEFGAGLYKFANPIAASLGGGERSLAIKGKGLSVTTLSWSNTNGGISVAANGYSSITISEVALATDTASGGSAVSISGNGYAPSTIENVLLSGTNALQTTPGTRTKYWTYGVDITGASFINVRGLTVLGGDSPGLLGTGVRFQGTPPLPDAPSFPIVLNIAQSNFIEGYLGVLLGNQAQGITISQSNFTGGQVGISDIPSGTNLCQLNVSDSQFAVAGDAVSIQSTLSYVFIHDNLFGLRPNQRGIYINGNGYGFKFVGNYFRSYANHLGTGIYVSANQPCDVPCLGGTAPNCSRGVIVGNSFERLAEGTHLDVHADGWNVQSNGYHDTVNPLKSTGASCILTGGGSL